MEDKNHLIIHNFLYLNWLAVNVASRALDSSVVSGSRGLLQITKNLYESNHTKVHICTKYFVKKGQMILTTSTQDTYSATIFCDEILEFT